MSSRFQVKIRTEDSIRRYSFEKPPSWGDFIKHISLHLYPTASTIPFKVEYKDDEGDIITIDSDEEWQEMIKQQSPNQIVQLFIKEKSPSFSFFGFPIHKVSDQSTPISVSPLSVPFSFYGQEEKKKAEEEERRRIEVLKLLEEEKAKQLEEEKAKQLEEEKRKEVKRQEELKKIEEKKNKEQEHKLMVEKLKRNDKAIKEKEQILLPPKRPVNPTPEKKTFSS